MKKLKRYENFNEGFFDRFSKKEKEKETLKEEGKIIRIDDSEFWAKEDGESYLIYHRWGFGGSPLASVNDKLILTIYSSDYDDIKKVKGSRIKVKSIEQALKYLQKIADKEKQKRESELNSFDKDISNEEF